MPQEINNFIFKGIKLHYVHVFPALTNRVETLDDTLKSDHRFQTDFSLYTVIFSIIAVIIAILAIFIK